MTQRMDYNAATPAGMKALGGVYGHIMGCGLPKVLVDLVYLRVSQINGCAYCIDMHGRDLRKAGVPVEKILLVSSWDDAGSLFSDQEKAALEKLFTQVQDISSSFYSGDLAGAFDRAMALDMDSSQLASMSLRLTQTSVRQATDTYGSVSSQGGQPASAVNGALTDYAQSLLDALRTAGEVTGDGKGLLQQLLKGGFSLDERFDSTRLDKADQLNDRLLDGLQGMLASTLQPQARDDQAN